MRGGGGGGVGTDIGIKLLPDVGVSLHSKIATSTIHEAQ